MNITEAATHLGDLLDATTERYPMATRILHLNQAVNRLGVEFETSLNEGVAQVLLQAGATSVGRNPYNLTGSLIPMVYTGIWGVKEYTDDGTPTASNWTADEAWSRIKIYPDYNSLMDASPNYQGSVFGFAQHGGALYVMNTVDYDILLRMTFHGRNAQISGNATNDWLTIYPFLCIYKAAELSCLWLEDESRIPVYKSMFDEEAQLVNLADSRRGDDPIIAEEA